MLHIIETIYYNTTKKVANETFQTLKKTEIEILLDHQNNKKRIKIKS